MHAHVIDKTQKNLLKRDLTTQYDHSNTLIYIPRFAIYILRVMWKRSMIIAFSNAPREIKTSFANLENAMKRYPTRRHDMYVLCMLENAMKRYPTRRHDMYVLCMLENAMKMYPTRRHDMYVLCMLENAMKRYPTRRHDMYVCIMHARKRDEKVPYTQTWYTCIMYVCMHAYMHTYGTQRTVGSLLP